MKKNIIFSGLCCLILLIGGCSWFFKPGSGGGAFQPLPPYSGPKARLAVSEIEVISPKANTEIATGLKDMLITALINTNRFFVVPRQASNDQAHPQEPQPDLIISGALVEFEPQPSGGKAGIGGGGGTASGALGGLLGVPLNKARLSLDVRIIEAPNLRPLTTGMCLKGQASDFTLINSNAIISSWPLSKELAIYSRTPMEKAIRICITEVIRYLAENIPQRYYKHKNERN